MEKQNKNHAKHIFLTGSIVAGSLLGFGAPKAINAENLFNFGSLGSGAELRTSLLNTSTERNLEMKCGSKGDSKAEKNLVLTLKQKTVNAVKENVEAIKKPTARQRMLNAMI